MSGLSGGVGVWHGFIGWLVMVLTVWMAGRVVVHFWAKLSQPAEPDDYAEVAATHRPRPKLGAGAVALVEPDENDQQADAQ